MTYYVFINNKEVLLHNTTWMNRMLKLLAKLKISGTKGHKLNVSIYIKYLEQTNLQRQSTFVVAKAGRGAGSGERLLMGIGFLLARQDVQELDCGDGCTIP